MNRLVVAVALLGAAWIQAVAAAPRPLVAAIEFPLCGSENRAVAESCLYSRVGEPFSVSRVNADIRALMRTRRFDDVRVSAAAAGTNLVLTYNLVESPTVREVTIEPRSRSLTLPAGLVQMKAGKVFSRATLRADVQRITAYYHDQDFHAARVTTTDKLVRGLNQVYVAYVVREGERQYIEKVEINSTGAMPAALLRSFLHCEERNRLRFVPGLYNEATLAEDEARIRAYYLAHGYLDSCVTLAANEGSTKAAVRLELCVTEGPVYRIGSVTIEQRFLDAGEAEALRAATMLPTGSVLTQGTADEMKEKVRKLVVEWKGFEPFVTVRTLINGSSTPDAPVVDLLVKVTKSAHEHGPQAVVYPFAQSFLF